MKLAAGTLGPVPPRRPRLRRLRRGLRRAGPPLPRPRSLGPRGNDPAPPRLLLTSDPDSGAESRLLMTKAFLLAVAALVFGVLAVVVPDRLFPPEMNYRTISVARRGVSRVHPRVVPIRDGRVRRSGARRRADLVRRGRGEAARGARPVVPLRRGRRRALSGFAFRGLTHFPSGGIAARSATAGPRCDSTPYRAVAAWVAAAPVVREACGEALRFGPAAAANGTSSSSAPASGSTTLTLDVEGEKGSGRLAVGGRCSRSRRRMRRPVVRSARLETGGRRIGLDSAGTRRAMSAGFTQLHLPEERPKRCGLHLSLRRQGTTPPVRRRKR